MKKKKHFFLATFFAVMATFAMAQVPAAPQWLMYPIDTTNDVTASIITAHAAKQMGTGICHVKIQVKPSGSNTWLNSDTYTYASSAALIQVTQDSLVANTLYSVRLVSYNVDYSDSAITGTQTVRTKQSVQPVTVGLVTNLSLLPKSGWKFSATAISQNAFAFASRNTPPFETVSDTIYFFGSTTDTVFFTNTVAGQTVPSVTIIVKALDGSSFAPSSPTQSFSAPAYTAAVMNFGTPTITKDSVRVNLNITGLGNAGNPMLEVVIKDSLSGVFVHQTLQTITSTGSIAIAKGGLLSNRLYTIQALATTPQNMTTIATLPLKTLNVNPATVVVSQQLPQDYMLYTVKSFISTTGSGDSSKVKYAELLEDNVVVNSLVLALTDTGTITFTQTNQTPGTSKSIKVRVTNGANLVTTSGAINVSMLAVGKPVMNPTGSVKTTDSLYVGFNVTGLGIPLNPTFHVVIKNPAGVVILDSTRIITQTGIIGIGKGGLLSNTAYTITAALANSMMLGDTDVVVITTNSIVITPNATPSIVNLFADNSVTLRVTGISYGASANNTSTIKLVRKIPQIGFVDTTTVAPGLIGSGTIPLYTYTDCVGGYTTQITVIDVSLAGTKVGNTLQQNMPLPSDVILADIAQDDNLTSATTLAVKVFGSGEGNASPTLKIWLYQNNNQVGSMFFTTVSPGMFDYPYSWDNLQPSAEYKVVAELSASGSAPSPMTKYFYTDAISGIKEIAEMTETQIVQVANVMGQIVAKGEYKTVHASLLGSQTLFFFTPLGHDGFPSGGSRKLFIH